MPEISQRAELMPASPIRKLVPLAEAARARGTKIYHLNIGQPDLPSPQTGLDALHRVNQSNCLHHNSLAIHWNITGRTPRTYAWGRS